MNEIAFNKNNKFDIQLSQALLDERRLGDIFVNRKIENLVRIELKSESYQWEQTGNICIEYRCDGKRSGLSVTEADYWCHELKRDGKTLLYLMFPDERLKELCRDAIKAGRARSGAGDGGRFDVALIKLKDLLR